MVVFRVGWSPAGKDRSDCTTSMPVGRIVRFKERLIRARSALAPAQDQQRAQRREQCGRWLGNNVHGEEEGVGAVLVVEAEEALVRVGGANDK